MPYLDYKCLGLDYKYLGLDNKHLEFWDGVKNKIYLFKVRGGSWRNWQRLSQKWSAIDKNIPILRGSQPDFLQYLGGLCFQI